MSRRPIASTLTLIKLTLLALLVAGVAVAPATGAAPLDTTVASAASRAGVRLQYAAAGHVMAFQSEGFHMTNGRYALAVEFVGANAVAAFTEQAKLLGSGTTDDSQFGHSVDVSGDTMISGAISEDAVGTNSGAAYIFVRSGSSWTEQEKLLGADTAAFDGFGWGVAIEGDTAVVGAPVNTVGGKRTGAAYVFVRSGTSWTQQAKLVALSVAAGVSGSDTVSALDGNAAIDAVFANSGPPNRVCLGNGAGGFTCSNVSADTMFSNGVGLGDVNGDTFLDAVFANFGLGGFQQLNRVCLGDGAGGFTSCSDVSPHNTRSEDVALGDVNGDTYLDAVFANEGQRNQLCLGDGGGSFSCSDFTSDMNTSRGVALGFVNNDGNLDAVFANAGFNSNQNSRVCLGDGTGSFSCSNVATEVNSNEVALGFVNGDALLDVVFANVGSGFPGGTPNRVCLGDGAGGFHSCSNVSGDSNRTFGVALNDLNGDSLLDAVFANRGLVGPQRNRVCLGDGVGGFSCSDVSTDGFGTNNVALGDVNRDGDLDAVFVNAERNRVCLGDGAGGFSICSDADTDVSNSFAVALSPPRPMPVGGTIVVEKVTDPPAVAGTFTFTDTIEEPNTFTLDHGQVITFTEVPADTYIVTEIDPPGFDLTDLTCVEDDTANSTTDLGARQATITLEAGETVTCTFTNALAAPPPVPVGGIVVPVNRLGLLAPWLGLVGLAGLAALGVVVVRRRGG